MDDVAPPNLFFRNARCFSPREKPESQVRYLWCNREVSCDLLVMLELSRKTFIFPQEMFQCTAFPTLPIDSLWKLVLVTESLSFLNERGNISRSFSSPGNLQLHWRNVKELSTGLRKLRNLSPASYLLSLLLSNASLASTRNHTGDSSWSIFALIWYFLHMVPFGWEQVPIEEQLCGKIKTFIFHQQINKNCIIL